MELYLPDAATSSTDAPLRRSADHIEMFTDDGLDAAIDDLDKVKQHDMYRLFRLIHGDGEAHLKIHIYPDSPQTTERLRNRSLPGGIVPRTFCWRLYISTLPRVVPWEIGEPNQHGFAIAWVPNPIDPKTGKVTVFKALWVDLDGGRRWTPESGTPEPDAVIRSRNGDHLYWRLTGVEHWRHATELLRELAIAYRGDPAVARPDHPLRLPGFNHCKNPREPFKVEIVHVSQRANPWTSRAIRMAISRRRKRR